MQYGMTSPQCFALRLLLAAAFCVCASGCADLEHVMAVEQERHADIIAGLEQYRYEHGRYPSSIPLSVSNGVALSLPNIDSHAGMRAVGSVYSSGSSGEWFCIRFGYEWNRDVYTSFYISFVRAWQVRRYPPLDRSIQKLFLEHQEIREKK